MKTKKITEGEVSSLGVSSLPTRPTAPSSLGGRGYTAEDMKAAFDRLPKLIVERFNSLLNDVEAVGKDSLAAAIKTNFGENHSLYDMLCDVKNGNFASYLQVGESSLYSQLAGIYERLCLIESRLDYVRCCCTSHQDDEVGAAQSEAYTKGEQV